MVEFQSDGYSSLEIEQSLSEVLQKNSLCSMATVAKDQTSYINTAYFCFSNQYEIFFLSSKTSNHSRYLLSNDSLAMSVYDSHTPWDDYKAGVQLFGSCSQGNKTQLHIGSELYKKRFPDYKKCLHSLGEMVHVNHFFLYLFIPNRVKILHEERFGEEIYVEAKIKRPLI